MINKDKVMKDIEYCLRPDNTNLCGECSYKDIPYDCKHALIKDVYELLKEQEAKIEKLIGFINGFSKDAVPVVRCKDCKHYKINTVYPGTNMTMTYCAKTGITVSNSDWYCADGERR